MQLIGIILIIAVGGLYGLWLWFMQHQTGVMAHASGGVQSFDIVVKGVYSPSVIRAKMGAPIRINFKRAEDTECSRFVNFPDLKIRRELPQNQDVAIDIKPARPGQFLFTCDMGMYQGKLIIE